MLVRRLRTGVPPPSLPSPIEVHVCGPGEASTWARVVAEVFADDTSVSNETVDTLTTLFQKPYATCVLASFDGDIAGGGAMSAIDSVAALYGASMLPRYRRKGIQTSIIHALLTTAKHLRCGIAFTLTHPGSVSQRNVEHQGLHVAYTRSTFVKDLPPM